MNNNQTLPSMGIQGGGQQGGGPPTGGPPWANNPPISGKATKKTSVTRRCVDFIFEKALRNEGQM